MDDIALKLGDELAGKKPVAIELSVKATDGSIDAMLSFPVTATTEVINAAFAGWIEMIRAAISVHSGK